MKFSRRLSLFAVAILLTSACGQQTGLGEAVRPAEESAPTTSAKPKHLTIAIQREPTGFIDMASAGSGSTGGAMNAVYIAPEALMVQYNVNNHWRPQLAAEGPAVDKGTWVIYPDGTMDVTWKLRPNVLLQIIMGEVVTMPLYWVVVPVIARKGVKVQPFIITNCTWEFFLWDKEV